jgi:hypothetical protein
LQARADDSQQGLLNEAGALSQSAPAGIYLTLHR